MADIDNQMEEALRSSMNSGSLQSKEEQKAAQAELKVFTDQRNSVDFTLKDAATFVAEMTPIVGDAMAAREVYDELQKDEPNYYLAGALGGAALIGLIPGVGDIAAKAIRKGAKEVFDVAKRVEVDPNAMGSGLGNVKLKPKEIELPPAENSAKTQISGTLPTYKKADTLLTELSGEGKTLDFGAGLGLSKKELGFDTYEPFPKADFTPDFSNPSDIPSNSYSKVTNLNVLNVVPRDVRDTIVQDIGRILEPNGRAVITTRGRDVMAAKGKAGPEPMSIITSSDTYQKGFTQPELRSYITDTLGDGFAVTNNKLGAAGVTVHKLPTQNFNEGGIVMDDQTRQAFALGGLAEDVDPVSGNEVPVGSMPEEVRDDIPAQLSEGEYVVPADVVRFFGVKFFEDIRAEAKQGFAQMEANGRVGGEPVSGMEMGGDELPFDVSELQMVDDGEPEQPMMNKGGYISGYAAGGFNPYSSIGGGFEIRTYIGPDGQKQYIQFMNGSPISPIPAGYTPEAAVAEQVAEQVATSASTGTTAPSSSQLSEDRGTYTGGDDSQEPPESIDWANPDEGTPEKFQEVMGQMTGTGSTVFTGLATLVGGPLMGLGIKGMMKLQSNAMLKGIQSQLDNPDIGETQRIKLTQIQYQMQGKDENGNDKPEIKNLANLFDGDTYKGNSLSESIANMFTAKDGKSYRNGQLVDDVTGAVLEPGIMNSTSNDNNTPPAAAVATTVAPIVDNNDNNNGGSYTGGSSPNLGYSSSTPIADARPVARTPSATGSGVGASGPAGGGNWSPSTKKKKQYLGNSGK